MPSRGGQRCGKTCSTACAAELPRRCCCRRPFPQLTRRWHRARRSIVDHRGRRFDDGLADCISGLISTFSTTPKSFHRAGTDAETGAASGQLCQYNASPASSFGRRCATWAGSRYAGPAPAPYRKTAMDGRTPADRADTLRRRALMTDGQLAKRRGGPCWVQRLRLRPGQDLQAGFRTVAITRRLMPPGHGKNSQVTTQRQPACRPPAHNTAYGRPSAPGCGRWYGGGAVAATPRLRLNRSCRCKPESIWLQPCCCSRVPRARYRRHCALSAAFRLRDSTVAIPISAREPAHLVLRRQVRFTFGQH